MIPTALLPQILVLIFLSTDESMQNMNLTYLLITLLLLNKFRILFHGNPGGSLSRRAPLPKRVDLVLLLPAGRSSDCVLFCMAAKVFWLDILDSPVVHLMVPLPLFKLKYHSCILLLVCGTL